MSPKEVEPDLPVNVQGWRPSSSLASGQTMGREHSPVLEQKIGLKFIEYGPVHQNKTQNPHQSVSPIRKLP